MVKGRPVDIRSIDLTPYQGRWVALIGGRVVGVGLTKEQALLAARRNRPKEEPVAVIFVGGTPLGWEERR